MTRNAVEEWKTWYRSSKIGHYNKAQCRHEMRNVVYEAYLERKLAAAQAERDALKAKADVSVCAWCGQECKKDEISIAEHVIACEKRPEKMLIEECLKLHDALQVAQGAAERNGQRAEKALQLLIVAEQRIDTRQAIIREQEQDIQNITAREAAIKHNYEITVLNQDRCIAALEAAHLPEMIDNLNEIMDFVFKNEPCGYYCDEAVGHVDHKYTNWLKSIIGDLRTLAAPHAPAKESKE